MGRFDGILICSDLDGTFWRGGKENGSIEAVKYFIKNGGSFCIATGRSVSHLKENGLYNIANVPCCLLNGSKIYDYKREAVLKESFLRYTVEEFLNSIKDYAEKVLDFECFSEENTHFDHSCIPKSILEIRPYKMLCRFEEVEYADEFKENVLKLDFFKNSYISKSWNLGVEFNPIDATKGSAVEFIKKHLGNIHTSIGIGDYENDLTLITDSDIGVAVGNAVPALKKAADFIVKTCEEGSIRDLIEKIENGTIKK